MAYTIPKLNEIISTAQSDVDTALPGSQSRISRTPLNVLTTSLGGMTYSLYGYAQWIARQTNVIECDDEYLDIWGDTWGVVRNPATYATGTATFTGSNSITIPVGTRISSSEKSYVTTASGTTASGTVTIPIKADKPGSTYNLAATTTSMVKAIANINSTVTVSDISGGVEAEYADSYRSRILSRIHQNGHGGSLKDWQDWTLAVPGVTRAWVNSNELGNGSVTVRFMMDDSYIDGIPLTGDILTVKNALDVNKPITVRLSVEAPEVVTVNVTISGLIGETALTKSAINSEIQAVLKDKSEPNGTVSISWLYAAVSEVTNSNFNITSPTTDIVAPFNSVIKLGTVTYV